MADGSGFHQDQFPFRHLQPQSRLRSGEIVVDLFAGGGGASHALETALARAIDIAINHNPWAVGMHAANHPFTKHLCEDVWQADPWSETLGRLVGWLHASPDCTHHSQARGGQPRDKATRSLSWVVLKWAGKLKRHGTPPRIISLENVEQILRWGPLVAKRDKATGRVVKLDGTVAARGERVPLQNQFLVPDRKNVGRTWRHFVQALRSLGYDVDWKSLKASDFGAGTHRRRLYMIARCDGGPIAWPAPTHGMAPHQRPVVTAADSIDFSISCPSIFLSREAGRAFRVKRPLVKPTHRRIAKGVKRYVLDAASPFIVGLDRETTPPIAEVAKHTCAAAHLVKIRGNSDGAPLDDPLPTITSGAGAKRPAGAAHAMGVLTAFLEQANGGFYDGDGNAADQPLSTITGSGTQQRLVTVNMLTLRGTNIGAAASDPVRTISAGGEHHAVVQCTLSRAQTADALRVADFLIAHLPELGLSVESATVAERLALVTVMVGDVPHVIVDIGLRMLRREELFRAQGFPSHYIIDRTADGRSLSNSRSVEMVGNSVSPPPLIAIAVANLDPVEEEPMRIAA